MYQLILYQARCGRWRWKFGYNNRIIARADYHYHSPSEAKRSFDNLVKALGQKSFSTKIEKRGSKS